MKKSLFLVTLLSTIVFIISFAGKCAYSILPIGQGSTNNNLRIFVTAGTYNGNLGGVSGADNKCANATNNPYDGAVFRAMIMGDGRSTGSADWVLKPNTKYYRMDKATLIGETNAGKTFSFPLSNSISTVGSSPWTGMWTDWTEGAPNICGNWYDGSNVIDGNAGTATNSDVTMLFSSVSNCNILHPLYCVEQ